MPICVTDSSATTLLESRQKERGSTVDRQHHLLTPRGNRWRNVEQEIPSVTGSVLLPVHERERDPVDRGCHDWWLTIPLRDILAEPSTTDDDMCPPHDCRAGRRASADELLTPGKWEPQNPVVHARVESTRDTAGVDRRVVLPRHELVTLSDVTVRDDDSHLSGHSRDPSLGHVECDRVAG